MRARLVYFDCVVSETISVIGRRAEEQKRTGQFSELLDLVAHQIPPSAITWVSRESERLYEQVLSLCRDRGGRLNFNDALMAHCCHAQEIQ